MISTEFAGGRIQRIALRGDAFVPVVVGGTRNPEVQPLLTMGFLEVAGRSARGCRGSAS